MGRDKVKVTYYKFVEEALYRNEAVSKLLTEIRHWGSGQLSRDNKMTDLHKHIHGVTAMERDTKLKQFPS